MPGCDPKGTAAGAYASCLRIIGAPDLDEVERRGSAPGAELVVRLRLDQQRIQPREVRVRRRAAHAEVRERGTCIDRQPQAPLEHGHATLDPRKAREGTRAPDLRDAHAPVEMTQITPGRVCDHLARHAAAVFPGKALALAGPQEPHRACCLHESGNATEKVPSRLCGVPGSMP